MTTKTIDEGNTWLCSVLPGAGLHSNTSQGSTQLEMHKRLVHLATLREQALARLQAFDTAKVSLTEKKAVQQGRLLAALDARLASAHAAVEPHRVALHDHIKALEKAAGYYSNVIQGIASHPSAPDWASITQQYQHLQQQQEQYHQQQEPAELARSLAASIQPCAVAHVEIVEQLLCEKDQLQQQFQHVNSLHEQVAQQMQQERAARLLAEQEKHSMQQELQALRQLAQHVAQQMQVPQQPMLVETLGCLSTPTRQSGPVASTPQAGTSSENMSPTQAFMSECQQLHQQLKQVSAALGNTSQPAAVSSRSGQLDGTTVGRQLGEQSAQQKPQQQLCQTDLLQEVGSSDAAAVLFSDPLQQLRAAVLGLDARPLGQSQAEAEAAAVHATGQCCSLLGVAGASQERLRQAYQHMLRQVQARYQQELRQNELQHQEALQSQSKHHTEAVSQLTQQYEEACTRLAAAATAQVELRQQLAQSQQQNQLLQQQVQQLEQQLQKVQATASASTASALAVAQVQHEQQLIALRREQEQHTNQARQDLQQLAQQLKEQAAALPSAAAVAAMVNQEATKQLKETEEQYQAALQQREEQHLSLLEELAALRQLHAEPSSNSIDNAAELPAQMQQQQQQQSEHAAVHSPAQVAAGVAAGSSEQLGHHHEQQQQQGNKVGLPHTSRCSNNHQMSSAYNNALPCFCQEEGSSAVCMGGSAAADVSHHLRSSNCKHTPHGNANDSSDQATPMSTLIAAVLGSGRRAKSLQELHKQRLQQQQQLLNQQYQQHQVQQQPCLFSQNQSEQLDEMLGLTCATSSRKWNASADAAASMWPESPIAKWQRAAEAAGVAMACRDTEAVLQQLNMPQQDSASNTAAPAPPKQGQQHAVRLQGHQQQPGGRASSSSQQQQQQQNCGSKQQCLRCGSIGMSSPGQCCFHPGLITVPGPLMYSPEWHACRAHCTPDMPGCYSRKEHYYLPSFGTNQPSADAAAPAGRLSGKSAGWQGVKNAGGRLAATAGSDSCRRFAAKSAVHGQSAAAELTPRTVVPRPITPRPAACRG